MATQTCTEELDDWWISTSARDGVTTWWASRKRLLTESEMQGGLVHTLSTATESQLYTLIGLQIEAKR